MHAACGRRWAGQGSRTLALTTRGIGWRGHLAAPRLPPLRAAAAAPAPARLRRRALGGCRWLQARGAALGQCSAPKNARLPAGACLRGDLPVPTTPGGTSGVSGTAQHPATRAHCDRPLAQRTLPGGRRLPSHAQWWCGALVKSGAQKLVLGVGIRSWRSCHPHARRRRPHASRTHRRLRRSKA